MKSSVISRLALALVAGFGPRAMVGQTGNPAGSQPAQACSTGRLLPLLPANAVQVAGIIRILGPVTRLRTLVCEQGTMPSLEEIALRQQITEAVLTAALD